MSTATAGLLVPLFVAGCHSYGPTTLTHDRMDYSASLAESWKSTMLLNVVKIRYLDLPVFLDVGQLVSSYTLEGSASVGSTLYQHGHGNSLALGGAARYSQQPTITYSPLTGDKFLEGFLDPIPAIRVFSLMQSGYAADFILQLSVDSLNGLRNQPVAFDSKYQANPDFFRALKLLREIQDARAIGLQVARTTNGLPDTVFFFRSETTLPDIEEKIKEARRLLGLPPGQDSFRLVQSPLPGGPGELSVATRSIEQILCYLSLGVELPPKHLERKLAPPLSEPLAPELVMLRIHSGPSKPSGAYAMVLYEGQWFWMASDDWQSKRTLTSILFLFTLAHTSPSQNVPTLTIPTR